ncbi:Fur family transcriptional regulator [Rhizobium sp. Root149]|jgi:Fur family zinc uptake transcriptional regulator|uniref:Ferric uptake regulation protein n=1 Tax=Rhizobium rhizoryzae TaxID=451876 RepID=A0A7W6LCM4_9HYPH|nr:MULTISPECIES: Fur family transcriptional regulator [Rhizobium]KQZ54787.1 Fur family transcriptional regulator [Rhizobium sp. Root149]MBB4141894.1 Fur family zinc uptake transcriptional regulator [Rhizobium rhizoryzae]
MSTVNLTKNQTLVLDVLTRSEGPLSAYTILDKLRDHGFRAPLQVYRALEKLLEFGLVHRLESLNSFVACAHREHTCCSHGTVAFAICESCGHVSEFHDHVIDDQLNQWTRGKGFKPSKTTIEIRGLCAACNN